MALLFCDGFDSYTATADLLTSKKWQSNTGWTWSATAGRNGGGGITTSSNTAALWSQIQTFQIASGGHAAGVCFWFKASAPPSGGFSRIVAPQLVGGGTLIGWGVQTTGVPVLINGSGVVIATGPSNICDGQWHWVEWGFTVWNIGGINICYVDTLLQWNTGAATNAASPAVDSVQFTNTQAMTVTISWPFCVDTVGATPLVSGIPFGPQTITTIRPASDGACSFQTVSAGTNHSAMINQTIQDADATFVEGISGQQDLYNFGALGVTPPSILTVMVNTMLYDPAAGTINYQIACKSGVAAVSLGTSTPTPSSYIKMDYRSIPQDPNTAAAWTVAALNTAQFGVKIV